MGHFSALHRHLSQGVGNCNSPQRCGCVLLVLSCKLPTNCCAPVFCTQTIIGRQLKQFLDMPDNMKIGYSVFVSHSCLACGFASGSWLWDVSVGTVALHRVATVVEVDCCAWGGCHEGEPTPC